MQDLFTDVLGRVQTALAALGAAGVLNDPDDPGALITQAHGLKADVELLIAAAVSRARADGASWQVVGEALGISRQAAFQRYGKPLDLRTGEPMDTTPLPEAITLTAAVIADLASGAWPGIAERFDDQMRDRLSPGALTAAWAQVIAQVGSFEGSGDPVLSRAGDLTTSNTLLRFEAGDMILRLAVRDDQTIAGLYILPDAAQSA